MFSLLLFTVCSFKHFHQNIGFVSDMYKDVSEEVDMITVVTQYPLKFFNRIRVQYDKGIEIVNVLALDLI